MKNNYLVRQGDLLIQKVNLIPKGKTVLNGILLRGESTGHSHRIVGGKATQAKEGLFFEVTKKAQLVHEEHGTIEFTPGKYAVIRQREYLSKDMVRVVID
jgi:hypothetical protein